MEDNHAIRFVKNDDGGFEFAYFGIFDGHGGAEASKFARDNLLDEITKYESFWSDNDDDILEAIKTGFIDAHHGMWRVVGEFVWCCSVQTTDRHAWITLKLQGPYIFFVKSSFYDQFGHYSASHQILNILYSSVLTKRRSLSRI